MSTKVKPAEDAVNTIVSAIEQRLGGRDDPLVVAIDGKSGVGKTAIAKEVVNRLGAVNVLCDDFFTGGHNDFWAKRTTQQKIDNVIDWERIKKEVILPLKSGKKATWHPFDWKKFEGLSPKLISAEPQKVVILDGAFSNRPELRDVIDYSILVEAPKEVHVSRVKQREGEEYSDDWHKTWEESMEYYFAKISPPETFDLIVQN
jgi:uridine kinase